MAETRFTQKDAERCFDRLVEAVGGRRAKSYNDVGGLRLDYNATYGGANVEEISNSSGGVSQPFGSRRMKPAEFCLAVRMVEDAVRYRKEKESPTSARAHATKSKKSAAQLNREIVATIGRPKRGR